MASIGSRNTLPVLRLAAPGLILDGGELGELLLPRRYASKDAQPGDSLEVFVYRDSDDRLITTTETPKAVVGDFAFLEIVSVDPRIGAFLDWGLSKDLLLPMREQSGLIAEGRFVVVHVQLDELTGRIIASARLNRHLNLTPPSYEKGQKVRLLVAGRTPLGYKAIVEGAHWGLLYESDLTAPLSVGLQTEGYVRKVRADGKVDLALEPAGYKRRIPTLTEQIVEELKSKGRLECDDNSSPDVIREQFHTSKKAFKQALGALYRERRIRFTNPGVEWIGDRPGKRSGS